MKIYLYGMITKVVLLTGSELRHEFFRKFLASETDFKVVASYCESKTGNLIEIVQNDTEDRKLRSKHLRLRRLIEEDFFALFCASVKDYSKPVFIEKGEINNKSVVNAILDYQADLLISYGCSIIRSELLQIYKGRFINIHLGLSPYYRGSGTNFWPVVNNELQFIGTTFMNIDAGIDTGEIIHQIRARIYPQDTIHQIGNRLILDSFYEIIKIISNHSHIVKMKQSDRKITPHYLYRKRDFSEHAVLKAQKNLEGGIIERYLNNKAVIDQKFPIISNPSI